MNITVLSGKGGTGKTTVSTNLAIALSSNYIDCDVEEPNGFLFLKPEISFSEEVTVDYPKINKEKCIACGKCVETCQFNALVKVEDHIMTFPKLCHSCGACELSCDYGAINYEKRVIGKIERGESENIKCQRGILEIGEPMSVPVINKLLKNLDEGTNLIDCPPGTSCNVVNTLRYADVALLVTEPTKFGLHDLKRAVELVRSFKLPFGVIINKDDERQNQIRQYCKTEDIPIIGSIPYSKDIASCYSKGHILYKQVEYKAIFDEIANKVKEVFKWS